MFPPSSCLCNEDKPSIGWKVKKENDVGRNRSIILTSGAARFVDQLPQPMRPQRIFDGTDYRRLRRFDETHVKHWHQALTTSQEFGIGAECGEQR